MSELHEALSHLQPHDGHMSPHEQFEEDLGRALEEEIEHQYKVEDMYEQDVAFAHELGHHGEPVLAVQHGFDTIYHGSEVQPYHVVEDEPSWRDDKYHDHTGFDLTQHSYEADNQGMAQEQGEQV